MTEFTKDSLRVKISDTAENMGKIAAEDIYRKITELLEKKDEINIIFAAAPSQNTTLDALLTYDIDWGRINAFHMDEYIGLTVPEASFQMYLRGRIFDKAPFKSVNFINAGEQDIEKECKRYSALLEKYPTDLVILGIGENGHIAFNDPPVADFNDKALVKPVKLDEKCKAQQVHDGCFATIDDVPQYALTLTVPALLRAKDMFCVVPYSTKAEAVCEMLTTDKIDEHCPATALRNHSGATLYCDGESSALLTHRIKSERILTNEGFKRGFVYIQGDRIKAVTDKELPYTYENDFTDKMVVPGFIDLHLHGGMGYNFIDCTGAEADIAANYHLAHGTTTLLPTLSASSYESMRSALSNLKNAKAPNIAGVHIEGPYFAVNMCGAQNPEFITPPVEKDYKALVCEFADFIKRWSYAPERDTDFAFTKFLKENGIIASAGHTDADYESMQGAEKNGCSLITHLFSCTSTVTRHSGFRKGGVIEFALENEDITAELITDGAHLPPELIRLVYKVKGREKVTLTTDALSVCGLTAKSGTNCGIDYIVEDGVCKLPDRSAFAGSIATADRLIRTCVSAGISLEDSVYMLTKTPADLLGIDAGELTEGKRADIVVLDDSLNVSAVFKNGKPNASPNSL